MPITRFYLTLYCVFFTIVYLNGCGTPNTETEAGTEVSAGETPAGEVFAGEMPAGEVFAGEIPAGEMPAGEMPAGEMPAGEMPAGEMPAGEMPAGEMPAGEMPAGEMPAGEINNTCESDDECQEGEVCLEETCQLPPNYPDFCRFQSPLSAVIETEDELTVSARVFEQGITNATPNTDPNDLLLAQIGWRQNETDEFEWVDATPNLEYNGLPLGQDEATKDEYIATLRFSTNGTYELAARFSVNGGNHWLLCDHGVDGAGSDDGYSPSEAGSVLVLDPCDEGFSRQEDHSCADIDDCLVDRGGCDENAQCINNIGSPRTCTCNDGYEGDGFSCNDIDECAMNNGGCDQHAICTNNEGSAPSCTCIDGYDGNGQTCDDVNECAMNNGGCDQHATCTNNIGALPSCECNEGYQGNGQTCEDIDECALNNGGCDTNALCTNNEGAEPTCACRLGYIGNGYSCNDVDECLVDNGGCDENASCNNEEGAPPTCICDFGYAGNGQVCSDVNECLVANGGCDQHATCTNNIGALPNCECNSGYQGNGQSCEDIDECAMNNGGCDQHATCTNNIGALPSCECNPGYQGNGQSCLLALPTSVDELQAGDLIITEIQANPGSVTDVNGEWFEIFSPSKTIDLLGLVIRDQGGTEYVVQANSVIGDRTTVIQSNSYIVFARNSDVTSNGGISADFTYTSLTLNNDGDSLSLLAQGIIIDTVSYSGTTSGASISLNGDLVPSSIDNDDPLNFCESTTEINLSDKGTPGAPNDPCPLCRPGFVEVSNGVCEDIDECTSNNGGCANKATCTNNEGAPPTCTCDEGYEGDGYTCTDINECETDNGGCGDITIYTCQNNEGNSPTCGCVEGYTYLPAGICLDINECETSNGGCSENATCTNNEGAPATCQCNEGFTGDGIVCDLISNPIDYCRIQFPTTESFVVDDESIFFMRIYEQGLTDQSAEVDLDPNVQIQFGYGPQGSNPSVDESSWQWIAALPNESYDGNTSGEANNDEYFAEVSISEVGTFDFVFRVSIDALQTWVYCDTDGSGENFDTAPNYGYNPSLHGQISVTAF